MKRFGGDGVDAAHGPRRPDRSRRQAPKYPLRQLAHTTSLGSVAIRATGLSGARARDFEDFVSGDRSLTAGVVSLPDPSFRENLRRRLWRIHVLGRRYRVSTMH